MSFKMLSPLKLLLVLSPLYFSAALVIKDADVDKAITVPLNKTVPFDNSEIYGEFLKLNSSSIVTVNFTDLNSNYTFLLFQVHSQFHNISLHQHYARKKANDTEIYGTNLGLVNIFAPLPGDLPMTDTFYIQNPHVNITLRVYMSVHVYGPKAMIPGGCNMEFPVPITPYMMVAVNDAYITVDAAAPSSDSQCNNVNEAVAEFYFMYLPQLDYQMEDYFSGIRNMMSLKGILKHGRQLPTAKLPQRRLLSAYPGTGVILVAVAYNISDPSFISVYVPNHSYGCTKMDENGCELVEDTLSQVLCAALLFVGLFVSFFGHRFFKTEMFLGGFFSGFIITYILVNVMENTIPTASLVAAAALSGIFFGATWLLFWWLYGIPVLSVSLIALNVGFVLASVFYYGLPFTALFKQDMNFWALYAMVMVLTALSIILVTHPGNILCCAVLGGFATAYAMDFFIGSNLKYIFINIVRRATVPNFNMVVMAPPYEWRDMLVTIFGILVAILGWSFQHWHNVGRPPFPPPPRSTRPVAPDQGFMYGALVDETRQPNENAARNLPRVVTAPSEPRNYNERSPLLATS